jgi:Na+/proline symporter
LCVSGYGIAVLLAVIVSFLIGVATYFMIKGSAENFYVAGRSLPLFVTVMTLASQSVDSNALLGNVDLSYKYGFWDGVVLPVGLAVSLVLNGLFLAEKVQADNVLTRKYS